MNAWITQKEIAKELNISQQAVSNRINKLRKTIIKRATIVINGEKAGFIIPFSLGISIKMGYSPMKVVEKLKNLSCITEIWIMAGAHRITARGYAKNVMDIECVSEMLEKMQEIEKLDFQIATKVIKSPRFIIE